MAHLTREEREHYHISLDSFRTNLAVMEHERNEGRAEGRTEGRAKGRAEGEELANLKHIKLLAEREKTANEKSDILELDLEFLRQNM